MCHAQLEHLTRLSCWGPAPFEARPRRRGAHEIMIEARTRMEKHPR